MWRGAEVIPRHVTDAASAAAVISANIDHATDLTARFAAAPDTRLARFAQEHRIHLCGAVFEIDDDWPGHLFNTAFILDHRGELIHRYRKIQCADVFGSLDTTPGSILDRYLERYVYEALFPVADIRLGRLATAIYFDMNFPDLFRAWENTMYVASEALGGE